MSITPVGETSQVGDELGESDRRWCSWEPIASSRLFGILNMQVRKEEGRLTRVILPAWLSLCRGLVREIRLSDRSHSDFEEIRYSGLC